MDNKELELRLQNTEQALALALKKIEELSSKKGKEKPELKSFVDETVYKDLFSFSYNGVIDGRRTHENFSSLYRRVQIIAGQRFHKEGNKQSYSATPLMELKCSEYDRLGKLMADICQLIYDYKHQL